MKKLNKENVNSFLKGYNYRYCGYSGREHQVAPIGSSFNSLFFKSYDEIEDFFTSKECVGCGKRNKEVYEHVSHNKDALCKECSSEAFSVLAQLGKGSVSRCFGWKDLMFLKAFLEYKGLMELGY